MDLRSVITDVVVGDRLILCASICDDGDDITVSSTIAYMGEEVIVKDVHLHSVVVAHEGNESAFLIYPGEYTLKTATHV